MALMPSSFALLLLLMLLYWVQAAFFSSTKNYTLTFLILFFSLLSLTALLVIRWLESGHFPLSNLYESLLFLSWSLLLSQLVFQVQMRKQNFFFNIFDFSPNGVVPSKKFNQESEDEQYDLIDLLGIITSPMALLTYGFAFLNLPKEMQKATALVPALQSNWLMMHVTIMILSYAALICGSIISMAFLLLSSPFFYKYFSQTNDVYSSARPGPIPTGLLRGRPEWGFSRSISNSNGSMDLQAATDGGYRVPKRLSLEQDKVPLTQSKLINYGQLATTNDPLVDQVSLQSISVDQSPSPVSASLPRMRPTDSKPILSTTKFDVALAEKLDNLSYRALGLGFPLLTVGILSGAVWANEAWGSYWSWDPKETWALITWLVFAIYLHARMTKGWSGKKPAIIATVGFFVVWFCYLGVNLLGTGLHTYGSFSATFQ